MTSGKDRGDVGEVEPEVAADETLEMPAPELQTERPLHLEDDVDRLIQRVVPRPEARHRHERHLARGGMGSIEIVVDVALERRIAKKVIAPKLQDVGRVVQLFLREAQITAQLDHPAIVPVHELALDPEGRLYFTMKLVEGRSFDMWLEQLDDGALAGDQLYELIEVLLKVCDALEFAHSRGVIHCDIKPANVMVGEFGETYLMDWGLARFREGSGDAMDGGLDDGGHGLSGTPAFMAPEQASGDVPDERSDVFAIGALFYFALVGKPPFAGDTTVQRLERARRGAFVPLAKLALSQPVPMELERIMTRALCREPDDRYPSVAELSSDLKRFLRGGLESPLRQIAAGDHILREGEPGEEVFILVSGRAEVYKTIQGQKAHIRDLGVGDVFGEMAILTDSPRSASVVALEDCAVHVLTRQTLEREMKGMKPWLAALTLTLAERFQELEERSARSERDAS